MEMLTPLKEDFHCLCYISLLQIFQHFIVVSVKDLHIEMYICKGRALAVWPTRTIVRWCFVQKYALDEPLTTSLWVGNLMENSPSSMTPPKRGLRFPLHIDNRLQSLYNDDTTVYVTMWWWFTLTPVLDIA
jgi:hypothetical protein